jgi:hypothetical protein
MNEDGDVGERWTCGICGTVVRFMPGHGPPGELPSGWSRTGRSGMLVCREDRRRQIVAEAEAEARERGEGSEEAVWAGKRAMVAFEIDRDPTAPDTRIASRCRLPIPTTSKLHREIRRERKVA